MDFFLIFINLADINPIILSRKLLIVILLCLVIYFIYLFVFKALNKREKQQLIILIVLFFAATFFWSAFEQKPTAYNLFAQDFTNRNIFDWKIPTNWFQSFNPIFIIILAPIASYIWIFLEKKIYIFLPLENLL